MKVTKKLASLILVLAVVAGILIIPAVYATGTEPPTASGAVLNQIFNQGGTWGTYSGGNFQRQGITNLWAQSPNPLNIATTNWEPYKIDLPPSGATHAVPFSLDGADGNNVNGLRNSMQFVGQPGQAIDTSRDWKNDVAIDFDFALLGDAASFNKVSNVRIGVSVFGGDWRTCTLTVPFSNYVTLNTDNLKVWQHVNIPLSDLLVNSEGKYWGNDYIPNGLDYWTNTEWNGINGIVIMADCPLGNLVYSYLSDVKFVKSTASPENLSAAPSGNNIELSWTATQNAVKYIVSRGELAPDDSVSNIVELNNNLSGTTYVDTTAENSKKYIYYVQAEDIAGTVSRAATKSVVVGKLPVSAPVGTEKMIKQLINPTTTETTDNTGIAAGNGDLWGTYVNQAIIKDYVEGGINHGGSRNSYVQPEFVYPEPHINLAYCFRIEGIDGIFDAYDTPKNWGQGIGLYEGRTLGSSLDLKNEAKIEGWFNPYYVLDGGGRNVAGDIADLKMVLTVRGNDDKIYGLAAPISIIDDYMDGEISGNGADGTWASGLTWHWKHFSIPLSAFETQGTIFDPHAFGFVQFSSTDWSKVNSIYFVGSALKPIYLFRVADLKFVRKAAGDISGLTVVSSAEEDTQISWTASASGETPIEYIVSRYEVSGSGDGALLFDKEEFFVDALETSFTDTETVSGIKYRYYVQASDGDTLSEPVYVDIAVGQTLAVLYTDASGVSVTTGMLTSGVQVKASLIGIEIEEGQSVVVAMAVYNGNKLINVVFSGEETTAGVHDLETPLITISSSGYHIKSFVWGMNTSKPYLDDTFLLN